MAQLPIIGGSFTIKTADQYVLPAAHFQGVATKVIQLTSSSFSGSVTVKGRVAGSGATPVAIPYIKRYLNGAVADDSKVSTAITTDSLIEVDAAGIDVVLDCTAYTSGSLVAVTKDLVG